MRVAYLRVSFHMNVKVDMTAKGSTPHPLRDGLGDLGSGGCVVVVVVPDVSSSSWFCSCRLGNSSSSSRLPSFRHGDPKSRQRSAAGMSGGRKQEPLRARARRIHGGGELRWSQRRQQGNPPPSIGTTGAPEGVALTWV